MFCANCGSKLVDEARFCPTCGRQVLEVEPGMDMSAETPSNNAGGVSKALASGRSHSRLRISPLILLVLVLALTSAVAAASYYVYTQVYLPSTERGSYEAADAEAQSGSYLLTRKVSYDENGTLVSEKTKQLDSRGATIQQTDAKSDGSSQTIKHEYDDRGCLTASRYSNGNVVTYTSQLDGSGRMVERKAYLEGSWGYTAECAYSSTGELASAHNEYSNGGFEHVEYDAFGYPVYAKTKNDDGSTSEVRLSWQRDSQGYVKSYDVVSKGDDGSIAEEHFTCSIGESGLPTRIYDSAGVLRAECEYTRIDNPYPAITHEVNSPCVVTD